jgi:hypothetical protein
VKKIRELNDELAHWQNQGARWIGEEFEARQARARANQKLDQLSANPPSSDILRRFGLGPKQSTLVRGGRSFNVG